KAEQEQAEREQAEQERIEQERIEQERAEQVRLAQERAAREAAEAQMRAAAAEQARLDAQREAEAARAAAVDHAAPVAAVALADTGLPIDADLLEVFVEEAREILDHADGVLAQWHAEPAAAGHLPELQRDLHTLKGGARIAGLMPVGDLAHAIETLLEKPVADAAQA